MIMAAGAVADTKERERVFYDVTSIETFIEKRLYEFEKDLADAEETAHLLKVSKTRKPVRSKTGKVRPRKHSNLLNVDVLSSSKEKVEEVQVQQSRLKAHILNKIKNNACRRI